MFSVRLCGISMLPPMTQRHVVSGVTLIGDFNLSMSVDKPCDRLVTCPGCTPPLPLRQLGQAPAPSQT